MIRVDEGSTSPTLLREVSDWRNHASWLQFHDRYGPLLRRWCHVRGLDEDSVDEVCQRIWIELADRMRTFRYDPSGTFRGWLRQLCDSRVIDFQRQRQAAVVVHSLDDGDEPSESVRPGASIDPANGEDADDVDDPTGLSLLGQARMVQAAVRRKVYPRTWNAFWLVAVRDWSVAETAEALEMTRTAVYASTARVGRMLRDEAERLPAF